MAIFGFLQKKESATSIGLPPPKEGAEGRHVSYLELPPLPKTTTQPTPIKMPEFPKMPAKEDVVPSAIPPIETPKMSMPSMQRMIEPRKSQVFVGIQQYNSVLSELDKLKSQISAAENTLQMLLDNKSREDSEFERWRANLEDIERKLLFVDKTLFE